MTPRATTSTRPASGPLLTDNQLRRLEEEGYVVIPDVLSPDECDVWSRAVDEAWERDQAEQHDYVQEPGVQFVENPLRQSILFERCATEPVVLEAVRVVLGPNVLLSTLNARRSDPGYGNQPLHDLKRRRGRPFGWCDAIWCLDEFTPANGTRVVPGSHLAAEPYLSRIEDSLLPHPDEEIVEASRGSVLVFNGSLIHGGNTNRGHAPRRSIQSQFVLPGQKTEYEWAELPRHIQELLGAEARGVLGLSR